MASLKEQLRKEYLYEQGALDDIKLMQMTMEKQLPSERFSGVLNILFALSGNGTDRDMENALVRKIASEQTRNFVSSLFMNISPY